MSNTNRELIGYIKEVTYGVNPGGNKQILNFTNYNVAGSNESTNSNFVRADTNKAPSVRTGVDVSGDLGGELTYGGYDEFIEGGMRATFPTAIAITATDISFASGDNSINSVAAAFTNVQAGQWVKIGGSPLNSGCHFIVSKTSSSKIIAAGSTITTESAGASITLKGTAIKNGIVQNSFTAERQFQDVTNAFLLQTGLRVNDISLSFATGAISTLSFSLIGKNEVVVASSGFSGNVTAVVTPSMNSINDVKKIIIDNTLYTGDLSKLELTIGTNAEKRMAIGSEFAQDIQQRSISVAGSLAEYFEDTVLLAKAKSFAIVKIAFVVQDALNNAYGFFIPAVRLNGGKVENGGLDQDIYIPYDFVAEVDNTYACSVMVTRMPA